MPTLSRGLKQAYDLQDFAFASAMALKDALTGEDGKLTLSREDALAVKSLVSSWKECQERIAFHRRVPSPGALKPEHYDKRRLKRIASPQRALVLDVTPVEPAPLPASSSTSSA